MPAVNHRALAHRLRELRKHHWSDVSLTQTELAEALGVSTASISSWEKPDGRALPRAEMLATYASFFATRRSVERRPFRVLNEVELDNDERTGRDELESELLSLRDVGPGRTGVHAELGWLEGPWRYPPGEAVIIVCGEVPAEQRDPSVPPEHPTLAHGKLYSYADIDALFELHGHIRAANPLSRVEVRKIGDMSTDDFSEHLVVLGGVDWNEALIEEEIFEALPVRQVSEGDPAKGFFETTEGEEVKRYPPKLNKSGKIIADVGHFVRRASPFNTERTVTLCNAMYSVGVLGTVRALTDENFRRSNAEYLAKRFRHGGEYSLLMTVKIKNDEAITPEWRAPGTILHTWPGP